MTKHKGWIWAVVGVVVLVVAIAVPVTINILMSSSLNIYVTPLSAKIVIDGREYQNGTYKFFPGEHVATISAEGFEDKSVTLKMEPDKYTNLFTFLNGVGENGNYYEYVANADDYAVLEQVAKYDEGAKVIVERIQKAEGIYDRLPIGFSTDDYNWLLLKSPNCEMVLCLEVRNYKGSNYDVAISYIREMGYTPEDYEILSTEMAE